MIDRPSKIVAPNIVAATAERINIYSGGKMGRVKVAHRNGTMRIRPTLYEVFNTSRDTPVVKNFRVKLSL